MIKLNKVKCKWKHYTRLSFRNHCQQFQSMYNVHRFFPSSIITRDHYIMLGTWRVAYMLRRVLEAGPNASKIWRGKKGSFTRSIHRHTRPIIGGNAVFGFAPLPHPSVKLFFPPNFFSLRLHETCNQSLLPKIRNDRVSASAELTIWEWRFGAAHKFRGLAITFHVPFRHKGEPTDVIRELLLSSFIP